MISANLRTHSNFRIVKCKNPLTRELNNRFKSLKACGMTRVDYKLGALIGSGSSAQVFKAMNTSTGEMVACKKIPLPIVSQKQLDRELSMLSRVNHKNVIRFLSHELLTTHVMIYCELLPLGSLKDLLNQFGILLEEIIFKYCRQIIEGLIYIHSLGILHLDLKSRNLLLSDDGQIKIADFGCCKQLEKSFCNQSVLFGSIPWMAPEVIKQEDISASADVWSFGCVILEMLTNRLPFEGEINYDNHLSAMYALSELEECPPLPQCSPKLKKILNACLKVNPKERATLSSVKQLLF